MTVESPSSSPIMTGVTSNAVPIGKIKSVDRKVAGKQLPRQHQATVDVANNGWYTPVENGVPTATTNGASGRPPQEAPMASMRTPQEQEVAQLLTGLRDGILPPPANPTVAQPMPATSFISRVSSLPMVNATFQTINQVYESGKNTSTVLRYSAETMESSVKTLIDNTKPMLPDLGRLDQFAQRQLDKLESKYPAIQGSVSAPLNTTDAMDCDPKKPQQQQSQDANATNSLLRWNQYLSAESMRSLKYCLECLQYASKHVDEQIRMLSDAIQRMISSGASTATHDGTANASGPHQSSALASLLSLAQRVKKEVVETLRNVVEIIGKYAGNALPVEAKNAVRGFILSLPNRWTAINNSVSIPYRYTSQTPNGQSSGSPVAECQEPVAAAAGQEARRVLSFAEESSSILKNTTTVFRQSVAAAEYWFGSVPPMTTTTKTMTADGSGVAPTAGRVPMDETE